MSVVALASAKGSPGVTTLAVALASWWPRPSIVIEADPAGGDLAARLALPEEPGLVSLAAAHRRRSIAASAKATLLEPFVQETAAGIRAVVAPASPRQIVAALGLIPEAAPPLAPRGTDLLVDIGRMSEPGVGARGATNRIALAANAEVWVWVCRPQLADLAHLAAALQDPNAADRNQTIVLVGEGPYPSDEVAETLGVTVLGRLPADPAGAAALWAGETKRWRRSILGRASKDLAAALVPTLHPGEETVVNRADDLGASRPEAPDQGHATVPIGGGR
jgi:hypothetical protein